MNTTRRNSIFSCVKRPYWFIRVTKPRIVGGTRVKSRVDIKLGFCDEVSRDKALKLRAQELDRINSHRVVAASMVTFRELAERYLETQSLAHKVPTQKWEKSLIEGDMLKAFGSMKLCDISRAEVERWLFSLDKVGWWSKDGRRRLLARLFKTAEEWGWFEGKNPALGIQLGRKRTVYERKLLTIEQFRVLIAKLDDPLKFLVLILFGLGLRVSEALGLKWSDVNWHDGAITICRRWHRGDLDETKTESSSDSLILSPSLLQEFSSRRASGWIFPGDEGNPADDRDLGAEFRPVLKRLGIYNPGDLWHQFRRMHITYKQSVGGATPIEAQKSARHASLDMTYLYSLSDAQRARDQQQRMMESLIGTVEGPKM